MKKFKLTQIDKDARELFGDLVIELDEGVEVTLVNTLRLSEEKLEALGAAKTLTDVENEKELVQSYHDWVRIVAEDDDQAELLIDAVGSRIDMWATMQVKWTERTQAGEASTSES